MGEGSGSGGCFDGRGEKRGQLVGLLNQDFGVSDRRTATIHRKFEPELGLVRFLASVVQLRNELLAGLWLVPDWREYPSRGSKCWPVFRRPLRRGRRSPLPWQERGLRPPSVGKVVKGENQAVRG